MSNQPPIEESEFTRQVMADYLEEHCGDGSQGEADMAVAFASAELRQSCDGCFHFPARVADESDPYSGYRCAAGPSCKANGYCHLWQPL